MTLMVNNGRTILENSVKHEGNIDDIMTRKDLPINRVLNQNFTMEELKQCIKNLDYKKAVGPETCN